MKSMKCINRILCVMALVTAPVVTYAACGGPYYYDRTEIGFFKVTEGAPSGSGDTKKEENLRLWQRETSATIPLADIEEIVYGTFDAHSWEEDEVSDTIRSNRFYRWIRSNKAVEVQDFLSFAKRVERIRAEKCSPWYYPAKKGEGTNVDDGFTSLIEYCADKYDSKLKVRYGLQMIRLLHSSCQYEECVTAYNRWFSDVPDNHLMKRMAMDYVAGAWTRLGDVDKANKYFALKGDISSLNGVDVLAYMAEVNPSAYPMREIEERLGSNYEPSSLLPAAYKVVEAGKAKNIGEWEFLLAYLEGEYNDDYEAANKYIRKALSHGLPTQTGRDHARAYKMAIDGARGNVKPLLADLKWLENKVKYGGDIRRWRHIALGIVYHHWFPYLTEHEHLPMAILLSNYIENLCGYMKDGWEYGHLPSAQEKKKMRTSRKDRNEMDFSGCLVDFIMMLKPQELIDYKHCLKDSSRLVTYLRDGGRNDDDFLNEMIGTLCLRECDYAGAIKWLSKVSPGYQYTLNTYKGGYLTRDPFAFTLESRQDAKESAKQFPRLQNKENIKLNFAKEMYRLEQQMRFGKNENVRAVAKVKYALARYASFSSCWALTAYKDGYVYPNHTVYPKTLPYYHSLKDQEEERMKDMVWDIVESIGDVETAAEVQYLLGNLKTVAKKYPNTSTGKFLSTHCDNWKDWI